MLVATQPVRSFKDGSHVSHKDSTQGIGFCEPKDLCTLISWAVWDACVFGWILHGLHAHGGITTKG